MCLVTILLFLFLWVTTKRLNFCIFFSRFYFYNLCTFCLINGWKSPETGTFCFFFFHRCGSLIFVYGQLISLGGSQGKAPGGADSSSSSSSSNMFFICVCVCDNYIPGCEYIFIILFIRVKIFVQWAVLYEKLRLNLLFQILRRTKKTK